MYTYGFYVLAAVYAIIAAVDMLDPAQVRTVTRNAPLRRKAGPRMPYDCIATA